MLWRNRPATIEVDEATTNIVQAIAHAGNIVKLYDTMKQASPSQQASGWQGLSPAEQESLKSVGYQPPKLDALSHAGAGGQHGGIWSDIAGGVSSALHDVGHVASDVPHAATDTLNALGSPLRGWCSTVYGRVMPRENKLFP